MSCKGNCKENVLQYLIKQNRPYSVNDLFQNLHNEYGKMTIQKALDDLTLECKIREKVYGKQKIYSVIQEEVNPAEDIKEELLRLDLEIEEISDKLKAAEQKLKQVEIEIDNLKGEPETSKAITEKNELEKAIAKLGEKLDSLSKTSLGITEEEKKNILIDYKNFTKQHRKRKQICMDILNSILENYPKNIKLLYEEIGIEADEEMEK